jgi:predicted nucleic acid-binding protein
VSKTIFLDTLFVVAAVSPRDQYHDRAKELAKTCAGSRFVVTDAVLLEVGNALARNFKAEAIRTIDHILEAPDIEVVRLTPELFDAGYSLYRTHHDKEWGLVDCISFAVMGKAGVEEALTFDQHFVQAGFWALMRE